MNSIIYAASVYHDFIFTKFHHWQVFSYWYDGFIYLFDFRSQAIAPLPIHSHHCPQTCRTYIKRHYTLQCGTHTVNDACSAVHFVIVSIYLVSTFAYLVLCDSNGVSLLFAISPLFHIEHEQQWTCAPFARDLRILYSNKCKTKSESFVKATTKRNPPSWHGAWHRRRVSSPVDLALQRL